MRETSLGLETRERGLMGMLSAWLGNSPHLWMWDFKSMLQALQDAGFVDIRRAAFGDAYDPIFTNVEQEVRWRGCLGFDCRKPA
jgi:hypothetical protein